MAKATRGLTAAQTVSEESIVRDTRHVTIRIAGWLRTPAHLGMTLLIHAAIAFLYPAVGDVCLLSALLLTWWGLTRREELPLKIPAISGLMDPKERSPKDGGPSRANGIFFLGNEIKTGKEVWLTNSDCRQHFLVLGTTGAGKTEALLGFASNAVTWGSGFLYCDGKGDVNLYAKIYALARRFGREDDLLVLNFMTGNQDLDAAQDGEVRSNTLNPFATGSSDTLTQMVVGLMDEAGGDGAMWKGRAAAMFTGVMRALTWLRDKSEIDLNVSEIRDNLALRRIIDLADQAQWPDMPQHIRKSVKSYLTSLPGFMEDKGAKQGQTTLDQHGYLEMQFTKILGSLADVYGHIFKTPYGEIDMTDVVLNRRLLVVMLPALEKSNDEIANLGKIVVATLKGMMGSTLGSKIEGSWFSVVEQRPTTSPTPFICILDEVGYYMVEGMDLMSAQARSLGFCLVFAGQDIPAMQRLNQKVFGSVQGNTNTKIVMRTEDPETAELAKKAGGQAYRAQLASFQGEVGEFQKAYRDNLEARLERTDRIDALDLKAQDEGDMHVIHKEFLVRTKAFYAAPESSLNKNRLRLRTNHFITVARPDQEAIQSHRRLPEIVARLVDKDFATRMRTSAANLVAEFEANPDRAASSGDEVLLLASAMAAISGSKRAPASTLETACAGFGQLIQESRIITAAYADDVRALAAGAAQDGRDPARRTQGASRRAPYPSVQDMRAYDDLAGGTARGPDGGYGIDPRFGPEVGSDADPYRGVGREASPRRPPRPLAPSRVRRDVPHGARIDDGALLDMADKVASNDTIMRTFQAMDFDAPATDAETVDSAIEEAVSGAPLPPGDYIPFDGHEADRADIALGSQMDRYDDEPGQGGDPVSGFLDALVEQSDDEEEDGR